jgi:hypothetical protein
MRIYYYLDGLERKGPYKKEELKDKSLTLESLIFSEDQNKWISLEKMTELKEYLFEINKQENDNKIIEDNSEMSSDKSKKPSINVNELEISNNKFWYEFLSTEDIKGEFKIVISDFMIKDSIDVDKFSANKRTNDIINEYGSLEKWKFIIKFDENPLDEIVCTKSFLDHYTKDISTRGHGIPDWFYIAYPDVTFWLQTNLQTLFHEMNLENSTMISKDGFTLEFFRALIDKYKGNNGLLECSINTPPLIKNIILLPGSGINIINLEEHIYKAFQIFGDKQEFFHHNSHLIEYHFITKGISIYSLVEDNEKRIFKIRIFPVCNTKTLEGISAGINTYVDMIRAYGEPKITSSSDGDYWNAEYSGIYFSFKKDKNINNHHFNQSYYETKVIDLITICKSLKQ